MLAVTKPKPHENEEWSQGFNIIDMPETTLPDDDHVLIEVSTGGICGTDVGIYNSKE